MAFSLKRKALESAQKYIQKGAFDKALKEYQKHLQSEPADTNARLKLGDLHLKRGDQGSAIEAYGQVAEQFSKSGFDAKAVAIYKQILKIDPAFLDARVQLGDHFQRMGLASDALREFQEAVGICQERGQKREAFDLLKRVASLDPTNVPNRLNLADLMLRENLNDEARQEYTSLLEELEGHGEVDLVARVAQRLIDAFPDLERGFVAFSTAKVAADEPDAAITALNQALPRFPDSIAMREALIGAFAAKNDTGAVQSGWREIAELYKRRGDHDKARDILQRQVPVAAFGDDDDPDSSPSLLLAEEAEGKLEIEPTSLDSQMRDVPEVDLTPPDDEAGEIMANPVDLLAEARVSLEFGDPDAARKLVERVFQIEPDSADARELLARIDGGGDAPEPPPAPAAPRPGPPTPLGAETLPDIELVLEDEEDVDNAFSSVEPPDDVAPTAASLPSPPAVPEPEPAAAKPAAPPKASEPAAPAEREPSPSGPETSATGLRLQASDEIEIDLGELDEPALARSGPVAPPPAPEQAEPEGATGEAPTAEAPTAEGATAEGESASWGAQSTLIAEHLEEAEFFFEQGMFDEAERRYTEILERVPNHPQALLRLGELAEKRGEDPSEVSGDEELDLSDTHVVQGEAPPAERVPAIPDLDGPPTEAGDGLDLDLGPPAAGAAADDEADLDSMFEEEPDSEPLALDAAEAAEPDGDELADACEIEEDEELEVAAEEPPVVEPEVAEAELEVTEVEADAEAELEVAEAVADDDEDDLVVEPEAEAVIEDVEEEAEAVVEVEVEDDALIEAEAVVEEEAPPAAATVSAEPSFDLAAELETSPAAAAGAEAPPGAAFDEVFKAFKKGIQEQVGEGDSDTHYDLAIAYKEMGLLDDALEQLEIVRGAGALQIEGLSLMATCKLELGRSQEAAGHLADALAMAGEGDESVVALRYDLGEALLAAGQRGEALDAFTKVAAADPKFRDVSARVTELGGDGG